METKHLSKEDIAICAEALATDRAINLPDDKKRHLKDCDECTQEVLAAKEVIRNTLKKEIASDLMVKKNNLKSKYLRIGIAAAIILLLAFLGVILKEKYNFYKEKTIATDTIKIAKPIVNKTDLKSNLIDTTKMR